MSGTRIAWLSPYGPRSDIGAFTRVLLPHFASEDADEEGGAGRFDCDLFVNANGPSYDAPVPMTEIPAGGNVHEILSRYDAAVFNLGNNVYNHANIADALRGIPGIAVLHDFSYHHFFAHKCFEDAKSPTGYARLIREYYGSAGFNMALRSGIITRDATLYAPWDGENVADYPLTQPLAALASAVVVHSKFMEEKVAQFFKGPILRLFLPSDQKTAPAPDDMARWRSETASKERCQFATFGHVGRPKCLETIVQAIAQSPVLRAKSELVIAGHPGDREYAREIEAMVAKLGLTRQVTFEYSVTDERLLAIKNASDVFLNLRFPNTEGASGSLVEMMNAGKAVIAYRAGCYADVPDDTAVLIERSGGIETVTAAMEYLLADPARRVTVGAAGQDYVRAQDSARYVRAFKRFVGDVQGELKRRARYLSPVRDAVAWSAVDVVEPDQGWFADLTQARRALNMLERDTNTHSPEIFLTWPMDDLIAFAGRVLLHSSTHSGLKHLLVGYAQRLGRWSFYRLISRVCFYQGLCQQAEISKADVSSYAERINDVAFWDIAAHLQPNIFIGMLYVCVLERAWGPSEQESWIKRIRQGVHPSAVLLDFLGSVEYRQAFPDRLMADVEDWARRETTLSSSPAGQVQAQIAWPAGRDVKFNEDNPVTEAILGRLWHRRDAQGRWSDGRTGDLRFLLPDDAAKHGATLLLRLRVAGTKITGQRRVVAHCNRRELGAITLANDAPQSWAITLPASVHAKDGVSLLLIADQDFSPAASGQSADKRSLGMMLIEGRLTVDTPGADEAEPVSDELVALPDVDAA
ncbi:MAG TPA: glycosyltransferase family 4 protein [Rhizomicrobium sp.]|nr:glycosyltransferase family 4 protein [Rhizomicrobium sp.]